jgi:phage nucleotide-binding protein
MMQVSYSRVSSFEQCPFKWSLKYIEELETIDKCDPQDALKLGTALHEGIETTVDEALKKYFMSYPIIDDRHINESIKLENLIPKVKDILPAGGEFEVELNCDDFKGFIDYLVPVCNTVDEQYRHCQMCDIHDTCDLVHSGMLCERSQVYDIYDFKYSNNVARYMESGQLHVYKYFAEKLLNIKIRNLFFVFVPKTMIRQKKTEDLYQFRQRLNQTLKDMTPQIVEVEYKPEKVIEFLLSTKRVVEAEEFEKRPSRLCDWCEYQDYCEKGLEIDMLPKNERVKVNTTKQMKGWIYGAPFSGKTTFLDKAPDPLNLNTDGNTNYVTMQRVRIRDTYEGRVKKFAWEIFKEMIDELEKGSDFKTIIIDLVEDTREMCRVYKYNELGITHESDSGYGKGWDIIKTEYLSTMRRFFNLDYNLFIISHENISTDLTKKTGDKITKIIPNIQEGIANKLAGMVDFVGRVIVNDDGSRSLSFKQDEVTFGGGRLDFGVKEIPLDWDELVKLYENLEFPQVEEEQIEETISKEETVGEVKEVPEQTEPQEEVKEDVPSVPEEKDEPEQTESVDKEPEEKPVRRTRRKRTE